MSDLSKTRPLEVFEREGVRWVVIGRYTNPCVLLQREDCFDRSISEHTRLAVVPESKWAEQWTTTGELFAVKEQD